MSLNQVLRNSLKKLEQSAPCSNYIKELVSALNGVRIPDKDSANVFEFMLKIAEEIPDSLINNSKAKDFNHLLVTLANQIMTPVNKPTGRRSR